MAKRGAKRISRTIKAPSKIPSDKAAMKRAARNRETIARVLVERGLAPEFASTPSGCLDQEVATNLVASCTGVGLVPPEVLLGQLFPSAVQRRGFCGCVFNKARMAGSTVAAKDIPCESGTPVGAVIDSISC